MSTQSSVVGNLTNDPDLQFGQSGKARATFGIAVNHSQKDQQGQWQQTGTTFYRVTLWEHLAEQAAEHLRKGQRVIARGRIETRSFTNKDGQEGTSLELRVDDIGPALAKYPPRDQSQSNFGNPGQQNPSSDPWGGQPQSQQSGGWGTGAQQDEPPF